MNLDEIEWLPAWIVREIHDYILEPAQLTGEDETRSLEAALQRVENQVRYGALEPDVIHIAASYAVVISRAHSFNDGNKRTALLTMLYFLEDHGYSLDVDQILLADNMERCAAGDMTDDELWQFIFDHLTESTN